MLAATITVISGLARKRHCGKQSPDNTVQRPNPTPRSMQGPYIAVGGIDRLDIRLRCPWLAELARKSALSGKSAVTAPSRADNRGTVWKRVQQWERFWPTALKPMKML